ncbi:preprotein translocase subunit YajC [Romboutsia maritimum]|uniref:Preprotein translocase subunit YajC n=1 Tax=Romboutsia maritimum TaxID=2020948 RepID=A0A371IRE7_9FIRM|nr:preprotein translocase subunit YajC [Romboutsia maritimum]RDY23049.1 preprotein translocase subunit YajC [Romboutsia maritimum]
MPGGQSMITVVLMYVAIFAIFYFLFIRPQKKKDKALKEMRANISVGDKVSTIGGIVANVAKVEEDVIILELGPNRTKVPFEKWAIGTVQSKKQEVE